MFGFRIGLDDLEKKLYEKGIMCFCTGIEDQLNIYYIKHKHKIKIEKLLLNLFKLKLQNVNIKFLKKIPYSSNGKILYSKLNDLAK